MRAFKNKTHPVMVATDVLSRGIDIDDISLIINYDVPNNPEDYIHRIGRTGRYDKTGTAITLVNSKGKKYYRSIKKVVGDQITEKKAFKKESKQKGQKRKQVNNKQKNAKKTAKSKVKRSKHSSKNKNEPRKKTNGPTKQSSQDVILKDQHTPRTFRPEQESLPKDFFKPDLIDKAVERNKRVRKPAKGFWGIIKSLIPKIKP